MQQDVSVFTYLQGETSGKIIATLSGDEGRASCLSFTCGEQTYSVFVDPSLYLRCEFALFDGFIPTDGLPRGARSLHYVYQPHDEPDPRDFSLPKRITLVENTATVKKCDEYAIPCFAYPERLSRKDGKTVVFIYRHLLAIPLGHTVLGYRIKPRSLAYQHTAIEASGSGVIFRTIVK